MLDILQYRELIVRPALTGINMWSKSAENLLVGTALVESNLTYLKQHQGPALGLCQMEPFTYLDLRNRLIKYENDIHKQILSFLNMYVLPLDPNFLVGNLNASAIMARIKYHFSEQPLPGYDDFEGLAKYHKSIYNTVHGATSLDESGKIFKGVCLYVYT